MPGKQADIPVLRFDRIDSTSLEARRRLAQGGSRAGPTLLLADVQTGGVGRFGRRWASPPGGVWMTLLWPLPPDEASFIAGLGLRIGLACALVVEDVLDAHACRRRVALKWPNDVLIDGRKVLGVLTEVVRSPDGGAALIGVGVNADFGADALPADLRPGATTLADALGAPVDRAFIVDRLLACLAAAARKHGLDADDLRAIRTRLHGVGERVSVRGADGATLEGTLLGLADDGRLCLDVEGRETLAPAGAELLIDRP